MDFAHEVCSTNKYSNDCHQLLRFENENSRFKKFTQDFEIQSNIETRDINNIVVSNVIYISAETDQVKTFIYDMLYMHIINGWFFKSN